MWELGGQAALHIRPRVRTVVTNLRRSETPNGLRVVRRIAVGFLKPLMNASRR